MIKDRRGLRALLVLMALQGHKAFLGLLEPRDRLAQLVRKDLVARLVLPASLALLAPLVQLELQAP